MSNQQNNFPYVEIVEQPASKAIRFRYECEGRATGCIPGENSEYDKKTYPSIRIIGYEGRAVIVISCVTKDQPYKPHPHSIVGKEMCNRGVCTIEHYSRQEPISFKNLGIQCVKKRNVDEALEQREKIRVDPFKTGFEFTSSSIDLSVVRLCFQVFLEGRNGKFQIPLAPVVSNPIYDKKARCDLMICKLSHCSAPTSGGLEMIILCEKVVKDNIQVVFYETNNDQIVWRAFGEFTPGDVHKQTAISFRTPRYPIINLTNPVQVFIQLRKPSDGTTSEPLPFTMIPIEPVGEIPNSLKRKRQRFNTSGLIDSTVYNQPDCKFTCQNQGASAAAAAGINIPNEAYGLKLLKQLETETESKEDVQILENRLNQQKFTKNGDMVNKHDLMPLKNVAPSIFTPRFMYNSNSRWNNAGNQISQMPTGNYQNKITPQQIVQPNPQCIPTISERPPPSSNFSLLPIQRQNGQMNNQNQATTLYKIQKPPADNLLGNVETPMDFNSNHLSYEVNPMDVLKELKELKELNSEDLAGLSETFSTSFSLADPTEFDVVKNLEFGK